MVTYLLLASTILVTQLFSTYFALTTTYKFSFFNIYFCFSITVDIQHISFRSSTLSMLLNKKWGLSACCHKSQTCEAVGGEKGKRFYSDATQSGRMADSPAQSSSLPQNPKSNHPHQDQNKSQCPEFLLHFNILGFGASIWLLSSLPRSLARSLMLPVSDCLLEAMGHVADKASFFLSPG